MSWFEVINKNIINEKAKLLVFPYAGGGVSVFRKWERYFDDIRVYAAQYPGRENRIGEEPIKDFDILLENIYENLGDTISGDIPYYLFGHSLGTKLIYELTLKIFDKIYREPKGLINKPKGMIVSAGKAPCFKEENPIYHLNDVDFISSEMSAIVMCYTAFAVLEDKLENGIHYAMDILDIKRIINDIDKLNINLYIKEFTEEEEYYEGEL